MDRGIISEEIRIGSLQIFGVYIDDIPDCWNEGLYKYGCYNAARIKVVRSSALEWHCFKPLVQHIDTYFKGKELELLVV